MKKMLTLAAVVTLTGCFGPSEEEKREAVLQEERKQAQIQAEMTKTLVQTAVRSRLKDPSSAQFGALTVVAPNRVCQTVNARNGFGGYAGDKQAFVMKLDGNWHTLKIEEVSHGNCITIMKDIKE